MLMCVIVLYLWIKVVEKKVVLTRTRQQIRNDFRDDFRR